MSRSLHRRMYWAPLAAAAALLVAPADAVAKPVVDALPDRGSVDWTRGVILIEGAASADRSAPRPDIARIRAERVARERAATAAAAQARGLAVAGGGTVGEAVDADEDAARRFARAVARAGDERVEYGSDGSVVVVLALPVEAVRGALAGPAAAPEADAPTALIITATSAMKTPEIGVGIRGNDGDYSGPTVFYRDSKSAGKDARLGERVVRASATGRDGAFLVVDGDLGVGAAQPLVVVVIGK